MPHRKSPGRLRASRLTFFRLANEMARSGGDPAADAGRRTSMNLEAPMSFKALGLAGIAAAMCAMPAAAHHSFAMFDASKQVTVAGTVKEFQWTNPHAFILMMVTN